MGLHDRDYVRDDSTGFQLQIPQSAVGLLILINATAFVVDQFFAEGRLLRAGSLSADLLERPWNCWQLVTYGFLHSSLWHVGFNMLALWMFGSDIEAVYGKREFLRIYFAALVLGGLAWVLSVTFLRPSSSPGVVGASGAVTCVLALFVFHYPRRMLLVWGVFPVPVWLLGLVWLLGDVAGFQNARRGLDGGTAYEAHLGGALLALAYYRFSWNFGRWLPRSVTFANFPAPGRGGRPKLKVHQPPADDAPRSLDAEVDRILAKISESGYDSLAPEERRTLERASARYQRRRQ